MAVRAARNIPAPELTPVQKFNQQVKQTVDEGLIEGKSGKSQLRDYVDKVLAANEHLRLLYFTLGRQESVFLSSDYKGPKKVEIPFNYVGADGLMYQAVFGRKLIEQFRKDIDIALADIPKVQKALTARRPTTVILYLNQNLYDWIVAPDHRVWFNLTIINENGQQESINLVDELQQILEQRLLPINAVFAFLKAYALNHNLFVMHTEIVNGQEINVINGSLINTYAWDPATNSYTNAYNPQLVADLQPLVEGTGETVEAYLLPPVKDRRTKKEIYGQTGLTILASRVRAIGAGQTEAYFRSQEVVQTDFAKIAGHALPALPQKLSKEDRAFYKRAIAPFEREIVRYGNTIKFYNKGAEDWGKNQGFISPKKR